MEHVIKKVDIAFTNLRVPYLLRNDIVSHHINDEMMARFEDIRQYGLLSGRAKRLVLKTKPSHGQ